MNYCLRSVDWVETPMFTTPGIYCQSRIWHYFRLLDYNALNLCIEIGLPTVIFERDRHGLFLAAHVFKINFWNFLNFLHLNFAYNLFFQLFWLERYIWVLLRRNVSVGVDAITAGRYLKYFQTLSCSGCLLLSPSVIGFKIGENEQKKNNPYMEWR